MFDSATLHQVLKERFGFSSFRPGQEHAIQSLLNERRVVCIQPTGYGKSLLYQLPAVLLDGITLVISPLLALMRDQMEHLQQRFGVPAGSINSDQDEEENYRTREAARHGHLKILFIAPEQLDNLDTRAFIQSLQVALMVVDEAHCISTWGHDFRPSYRSIVRAAHALTQHHPDLRLLGLTATADARVEADIASQFAAPDGSQPKVLRSSMDRPNIALGLVPLRGLSEKLSWLAQALSKLEGCAILYCATREQTEIVADWLQAQGLAVQAYHAGFEPEEKRRIQGDFISGRAPVIAATNALGMGIDKPDIRLIVHVDTPGSITAYYQEVGRAGRDGLSSRGILLFDPDDRKIQDHFIHSAQPTRADFTTVRNALTRDREGTWPNLAQVRIKSGLHPTRALVVLAEFMEQGFVDKVKQGSKQVYHPLQKEGEPDLARYEQQHSVRTKELDTMMAYGAGTCGCLMQTLRKALGDEQTEACGRCSDCQMQGWAWSTPGHNRSEADLWVSRREVVIKGSKRPLMSDGLAVLNGDQKGDLFIDFMKHRAKPERTDLSALLCTLLEERIDKLATRTRIQAVMALPSRTWSQGETVAQRIAKQLDVPIYQGLSWREPPEFRQGFLTNNDQRKQNVAGKMVLQQRVPVSGAILLLDDYVGSGSTLKEAVNCLRKAGHKGDIIPFTIARVRWRLGKKGFL